VAGRASCSGRICSDKRSITLTNTAACFTIPSNGAREIQADVIVPAIAVGWKYAATAFSKL